MIVGGVGKGLAVLLSAVVVLGWGRGVVGGADGDMISGCLAVVGAARVCALSWGVVGVADGDISGGLVVVGAGRVCALSHMRVSLPWVPKDMLAASLVFRNCTASSGEP